MRCYFENIDERPLRLDNYDGARGQIWRRPDFAQEHRGAESAFGALFGAIGCAAAERGTC
ncbi:hypothetical protein D3C84_1214840 [compost metagenome]